MADQKPINETIGKIKCPIAGDWAEVRKDKRGKFYYVGDAGMIKPNMPAGQEWVLENAVMFGKQEAEKVNAMSAEFGRRVLGMESDIKVKTENTQPPPQPAPQPTPPPKKESDVLEGWI